MPSKEPKFELVEDETPSRQRPGQSVPRDRIEKRVNPWAATTLLLAVAVFLFLLFPGLASFAAMAARNLLYLWWLVLLVGLALWLLFSVGRTKPPR